MKYGFNTRYQIGTEAVPYHGEIFFVRKEHQDDILILDEQSRALIEKAIQYGEVYGPDEYSPTVAQLAHEGVLVPLMPTKANETQPPTPSLNFWLQLTDTCNLDCNYCYIPSLNSKRQFHSGLFDLLARKLLSINGLDTVNIKLAGGEPLLAFKKWHKDITRLKEFLSEHGIALQLRIITNLTTLTDPMIRFIKEHAISISVSLDGLASYHDKNRIYTSTQKGTFKVVENNIKRLKAAGISPSVMVTVTSDNYKGIPDLVAYLVENDITFRIADAKGGYIEPDEFLAAMQRTCEILSSGIQLGFPVSDRMVVSDLRTHYPSSTPCSMGKNAAAIYLDGSVYFCHTEFEQGTPIGHLKDDKNLLEIIQKGREKHFGLSDDCQQCEYRLICAGGCPLYRVEGKSPMCQSYKKIIEKVFDLYAYEQSLL